MDGVSAVASVGAIAHSCGKVILLCRDYYKDVKNARGDIEKLQHEVDALQDTMKRIRERSSRSTLIESREISQCLNDCDELIKELVEKLEPSKGRERMKRWGVRSLKWPFTADQVSTITSRIERYKSIVSNTILLDLDNKINADEQDRLLSKLKPVAAAKFTSYYQTHQPKCLPETRVALLDEISKWAKPTDPRHIYWLHGMAGTGKSTIARTVAQTLSESGNLVASFFFSRDQADLKSATGLFSTLVDQLAMGDSRVREYVCEAISSAEDVADRGLGDQFRKLFLQPLRQLMDSKTSSLSVIVVIDALDECGDASDAGLLIQLLSQSELLQSSRLKILLTSRPETPIRLRFSRMPQVVYRDLALQSVSRPVVERDIKIYLDSQFESIRRRRNLSDDWPGEANVRILAAKADGLFIYASTICLFIDTNSPIITQNRFAKLLKEGISDGASTSQLDNVYMGVLKNSAIDNASEEEVSENAKYFRLVVGTLLILQEPLSRFLLCEFLSPFHNEFGHDINEITDSTLDPLHSVLDISTEDEHQPIRLLHPSFRDFLVDRERCRDDRFHIVENLSHDKACHCCVKIMSSSLRKDICDLRCPGVNPSEVDWHVLDKNIPQMVRYACRYWIEHLIRGTPTLVTSSEIQDFFKSSILLWLEAMSLLSLSGEVLSQVKNLESSLSDDTASQFRATICDLLRFVRANLYILERAPLQLYSSALIFAPKRSVTKTYQASLMVDWFEFIPSAATNWSSCLYTFNNDEKITRVAACSPDCKFVALVSENFELTNYHLKVWRVDDGVCQLSIPNALVINFDRQHGGLKFSNHGEFLAFTVVSSYNGEDYDHFCSVSVWSLRTGLLQLRSKQFPRRIAELFFVDDDKRIMLISEDFHLHCWNLESGVFERTVCLPFHFPISRPHRYIHNMEAQISSNEEYICIKADRDAGPVVFTLEPAQLRLNLSREPQELTGNFSFSPDSQLFVASTGLEARDGDRIEIWNLKTDEPNRVLEGYTLPNSGPLFNFDWLLLDKQKSCHGLLDIRSDVLVKASDLKSDYSSLATSKNGSWLFRDGNELVLWDGKHTSHLSGGTVAQYTEGANLSPCGKYVVILGDEIKVLELMPGALKRQDEGTSLVTCIENQSNGGLFAVGKRDGVIGFFGVNSCFPISSHSETGISKHVCIRRALRSSKPKIDVIEVMQTDETQRKYAVLRHWGCPNGILFSHDSHTIVSFDSYHGSVVFSKDDRLLAVYRQDLGGKFIHVLDTSGDVMFSIDRRLNFTDFKPSFFGFSHDSKMIALGNRGKVQLWEIQTGILLEETPSVGIITPYKTSDAEIKGRIYEIRMVHRNLRKPHDSTSNYVYHDQWLVTTKGKKRVLWLPSEFRPEFDIKWSACANTVVICDDSNRLSFYRFREDVNPLDGVNNYAELGNSQNSIARSAPPSSRSYRTTNDINEPFVLID